MNCLDSVLKYLQKIMMILIIKTHKDLTDIQVKVVNSLWFRGLKFFIYSLSYKEVIFFLPQDLQFCFLQKPDRKVMIVQPCYIV